MISHITRDITSVDTGIIAHGCNTHGVMGAGVAAAIKSKFPTAFQEYHRLCKKYSDPTELLGTCQIVDVSEDLRIANCFTQASYGRNGKHADIDAIKSSLDGLFAYASVKLMPIYLPKIGAGLGGLDWETDVLPVIEELASEHSDVSILICSI